MIMNTELIGDLTFAAGYKNRTQQARKISEAWVAKNGYCLNCESDRLTATIANTRTRDFLCQDCHHPYELKSKRGVFSTKVLDGAYDAMIKTIREGGTPTFLLLEYTASWGIESLTAIHHSLITETSILARKPLRPTARRAGWVGCNILLPAIALDARIPVISKGAMQPKHLTRNAFSRLEKLATLPSSERSWAGTILNMLHRLQDPVFSLSDVYRFQPELEQLYPRNTHVKPKIRQQLQVLRDAGFLIFLGRGHYKFLPTHDVGIAKG